MRIGAALSRIAAARDRIRACCRAQRRSALGAAALLAVLAAPAPANAEPRHAIAMHGEPAMPAGFGHFPYVNPAAPKGGRIVQGLVGSFDSLNPFIIKGLPAHGLRAPLVSGANIIAGTVVESLMVRSLDEPFTLYGLLAETIETDAARSHVTFTLNPAARFSDGKPVTADDVVFSWQLLRDRGRPNHRIYYSKVAKAEILPNARCASIWPTPRIANSADPRPDAGARKARDQPRNVRGNLDDAAARQRSLSDRPRRSRQERHPARAIPSIGAAILRSIAVSGISTRSVSTITATPVRITRPSRRDCSTCARRTTRAAGRRPMISPRCATGASSRKASPPACRSRASPSCSIRGARSFPTSACARRSRSCSISNG